VQSLQVSLFIPGEEVSESFISSHPGAGIPPFSEANLGGLQIIAEVKWVSGCPLSWLEGRVCFLGTKEEIFSIRCHGFLLGIQGKQLLS
jgi:hypothetical protein